MTGLYGASLMLIALPLAGAIVLLVGGRLLDRIGHVVGCATVIAAFFVMVVAAAEVVVGLAIIMTIFRTRRSASVDDASLLKY